MAKDGNIGRIWENHYLQYIDGQQPLLWKFFVAQGGKLAKILAPRGQGRGLTAA